MTNQQIDKMQREIADIRKEILHHRLYQEVKDIKHLQTFMEYHVYAVWDFMSLLKSLQMHLTCTTLPWKPVGDATTRYLINEIVTGEESDVDENGERMSHYELYLRAMKQANADAKVVEDFVSSLPSGSLDIQFTPGMPQAAQEFLTFTFDVIRSGKPHVMAAVFTFGREDLIPDMFIEMVRDFSATFPKEVSTLLYYLERHIEVDGDHHSHLALEMTANLCGSDELKWKEAEEAVKQALRMRKRLWDGVLEEINTYQMANP
jgi:hypothetical protein